MRDESAGGSRMGETTTSEGGEVWLLDGETHKSEETKAEGAKEEGAEKTGGAGSEEREEREEDAAKQEGLASVEEEGRGRKEEGEVVDVRELVEDSEGGREPEVQSEEYGEEGLREEREREESVLETHRERTTEAEQEGGRDAVFLAFSGGDAGKEVCFHSSFSTLRRHQTHLCYAPTASTTLVISGMLPRHPRKTFYEANTLSANPRHGLRSVLCPTLTDVPPLSGRTPPSPIGPFHGPEPEGQVVSFLSSFACNSAINKLRASSRVWSDSPIPGPCIVRF